MSNAINDFNVKRTHEPTKSQAPHAANLVTGYQIADPVIVGKTQNATCQLD